MRMVCRYVIDGGVNGVEGVGWGWGGWEGWSRFYDGEDSGTAKCLQQGGKRRGTFRV